eukprot:1159681-Pelagomonas_calceolata.AAC.3
MHRGTFWCTEGCVGDSSFRLSNEGLMKWHMGKGSQGFHGSHEVAKRAKESFFPAFFQAAMGSPT